MKKAHFIGICGIGMSAVAKLLTDLGWNVSGSDSKFYPPASDYIGEHGITCKEGYRKEHIPKDAELIVIGKNAKLTKENEEVRAAFESGISVRSFPEVISGLIAEKDTIVVAGSYGKSTAAAVLAWCLEHAQKHPGYFIGAITIDMENAKLGDGDLFVIEGDEYPSANWDATPKFLYYHPHDVLLTSAEHDHINVFPTVEEYHKPFQSLLALVPRDGSVIVSADELSAYRLAKESGKRLVTYAVNNNADWRAKNIRYGEMTTFDLVHKGRKVTTLGSTLLGEHGVRNVLGPAVMLLEKNLLTPYELAEGVRAFKGVKRRLERKAKKSRVIVYEGFGSSYEKARAEIQAMKTHFRDRRLIVVFEPHTFSWRNRNTIHWYDSAFEGAEMVLVYKPAAQGAGTHDQLAHSEIVERLQHAGIAAQAIHNADEGIEMLMKNVRENDVVLLLTSGDLGSLRTKIPDLVEEKFPQ